MFYGIYHSSTQGGTGCVAIFVSEGQPTASFFPQLSYDCPLCAYRHGFRLVTVQTVATPNQIQAFEKFCKTKGYVTGVSVDQSH